MSISTSIALTIHTDPDYHFTATAADDQFSLSYFEDGKRVTEREIGFASAEEMIAVAEAMIRAAKLVKGF